MTAALVWGVIAGHQATHPPRYHLALTPADLHLPYDAITLQAADGVHLAGWRLVPPSPKGVILVQHGYGTCRGDPLALTALLYRGGYAVLSVDFRGHGESGGVCTFGVGEWLDVRAMLDAVGRDLALAALPIGYLGISLGAAVGLLTAAEDPRIRAVVSDSSYARWAPMVARYQRMMYYLPEIPLGWFTAWCLAVRLGVSLGRLDPVRAVGRLAPRPLLVIHGAQDISIPVADARALHAAAGEPKGLWIIPGAGHVAGVCTDEPAYRQRVLEFFERGLANR